jgi:ligand-binding sensor domain-containing protein
MSTILRVSMLLIGGLAGQALALDPTQSVGSFIRTHFAKEDGLPSSIVNVILQTRDGFLWVGTGEGLVRFDGRHFTTIEFSPQTPTEGLSQALAEGPDGDLWAGTNTGVLRIPSTALDQFGRLPATVYHAGAGPGDTITALQFTGDGVLWAGTGRGFYRLHRGVFSTVLPDVSVSRIEKASNGRLLMVTSDGFVEWDGARLVDHTDIAARLGVSANEIFHVMEDHTGARWYCTAAGVAHEVNGSIERLQRYALHAGLNVYRAYEDPQGNVWLNLAGGLYRAAGTAYEAVPGVSARYIYADGDGDLWLGTNGDGLVRLKNRIVRMFTGDDGLGLWSNATMTVLDAGGGKLLIGSICGGLALFDGHGFRTYSHKDGLSNACVFAVAADRNNDVWSEPMVEAFSVFAMAASSNSQNRRGCRRTSY